MNRDKRRLPPVFIYMFFDFPLRTFASLAVNAVDCVFSYPSLLTPLTSGADHDR